MKGKIIGIAGGIGAGKDAIAEILVKKYNFRRIAFADNLKDMCIKVFNLKYEQVYTQKGKKQQFEAPIELNSIYLSAILTWAYIENKWPIKLSHSILMQEHIGKKLESPRKILQYIGTEILRRCVDQEYHTTVIFNKINEWKSAGFHNIIIPDSRFFNERVAVKKRGGFNLLVESTGRREGDTHASETSLGTKEDYDGYLLNDKSKGLKKLEEKVDRMINVWSNQ